MSFRRLLASIALIVVAGAPVAGVALAQVDLTSDTRRSLEADIERYEQLLVDRERELREIAAALGDTSSELERRIAERDAVSAELAERRAERERVNAQIAELEGQLSQTEARIAGLNERLGELRLRVSELLVGLYKQQGNRMGSLLAQSRSFHELQVRNYYVGLLSQQDAAVIGELDSLLYALDMERQSLEQQRAALEAAEAELAAVEAELSATASRLQGIVNELNATREGQLALQQDLLTEQNRLEQSLGGLSNQLEAEIERLRQVEAENRAAAARYAQDRERRLAAERMAELARDQIDTLTRPLEPLVSGFVRPLDGGELVSRFGEANNSFITIMAPVSNAAVRAVGPGRVAALDYLGANLGYMVAVEHDGGLMSIYVNLRPPEVEVHQVVNQGQVLGYLGGGTLMRNDLLQFYARREAAGRAPYVDPAPLLGW